MTTALGDIRLLDLSSQGPGPYCTMMLADMGADVIRVQEPELSGRRATSAGMDRMAFQDDPTRLAYSAPERNKRSITVNLKHDKAREAFYQLVKTSDALVEGYRPGVTRRLKIDYETLKVINPGLVYCSISGFGQDGPYARYVGHDINYIAIAGALGSIGVKGGPPVIPINLVGDFGAGGMQAAFGILAALHARRKTGRGQYLDISMTDGVLSLMAPFVSDYFRIGIPLRRGEGILNGGTPHYNVYETKDGKYISIGCLEPWFYENLCRALGHEDFIPHQHTEDEKREEIFRTFREIFKTRTRDEWFELLIDKDICVSKVYDFEETFNDPQLLHRGMVAEVTHPTLGKIKQVGISVKLSETPGEIRQLAATRGEHTESLLEELGYSSQVIEEMKASGGI
ncbi:CaiB/BaiF CoA transferase family protein [Chloroflexota bacterium]